MKSDIVSKLSLELVQPISTERQVVYILVETRKLLELTGNKQKYETLTFCCNWAVHTWMTKSTAQRIAIVFDRYQSLFESAGQKITDFDFSELSRITNYYGFRDELFEFYLTENLDISSLIAEAPWARFVELYSDVIRDCPIKAKATDTRFVSAVYARALPRNSTFRKIVGQLVVEWFWFDKSGALSGKLNQFLRDS